MSPGPLRVLIAEDKPENLELMEYLLRAFGHHTRSATNGAECLDAVALEKPDIVLMDLHMPVMDGFEAAARLKAGEATRDIPIVAVSALAMVGDREKVLAAGFDGYISKPIEPTTFAAEIAAHAHHEESP